MYICVSVHIIFKKERKEERKKERMEDEIPAFFVVVFKEKKLKKERKNPVICSLPHLKRKRKQTS